MVAWALLLLLGADDWECNYEGGRWAKGGVQHPCKVLVGDLAAQLVAAEQAWGLTRVQAQCALEAASFKWPTRLRPMTDEEQGRLEDASQAGWRRCVAQWPTQPMLWRAAVLSWNYRTPFGPLLDKLPAGPMDGGRAFADELLDLDSAPDAELGAWLLRANPGLLASLLADARIGTEARFELALTTLEHRAPTGREWDALVVPLLETPLRRGWWLFAAEQWLRLPEALRARVGGTVELAPLGNLRLRLALGLLALGKPEEARRISKEDDAALNPDAGRTAVVPTREEEDTALIADAVRWGLTGQRALSPWDTAITARGVNLLDDWEAWRAVMPFLHPHEAMFVETLSMRARYERRGVGRSEFSPLVAERLLTLSARSREQLAAQLHFTDDEARDGGLPGRAELPAALPSPFVERAKAWAGEAAKTRSKDAVKVPREFWPVRIEVLGKRTVVLALSQRLDPVGEVSPGGYWLLISKDGGAKWEQLYLSLSEHRPFHALQVSKVPLLAADDVVRLSMQEAPLDERSISFPPIAMEAPTKRELVVLEAPLAALRKDTDGDGLADLVEARLLLDPKKRDTDGDGVIDGDDPTPRLDDRLPPTPLAEMYNAFFEDFLTGRRQPQSLVLAPGVRGVEAGVGRARAAEFDDVRFIRGAAKDLGGLRPLVRLINLDDAEFDTAKARFGAFYPMRVEVVLNGNDHAFIEWSEGWRGGSLRIDRDASGKLVLTHLQSWIS